MNYSAMLTHVLDLRNVTATPPQQHPPMWMPAPTTGAEASATECPVAVDRTLECPPADDEVGYIGTIIAIVVVFFAIVLALFCWWRSWWDKWLQVHPDSVCAKLRGRSQPRFANRDGGSFNRGNDDDDDGGGDDDILLEVLAHRPADAAFSSSGEVFCGACGIVIQGGSVGTCATCGGGTDSSAR